MNIESEKIFLLKEGLEKYSHNPKEEVPYWVFVSHTASDSEVIRERILPKDETNFHLLNFMSKPILVAEAYKIKILRNIARCSWFMIVISKNALVSKWVRFEARWALKYKRKDRIVVVRLDDSNPANIHEKLVDARRVDFYIRPDTFKTEIEKIMPGVFILQ